MNKKVMGSLKIQVPLDVPSKSKKTYVDNYNYATYGTGNLLLFAGDQKVEHLNYDYYGEDISIDDASPYHLFDIAKESKIGVFATQLGLIAQHGHNYPDIPYVIKMNSKTNFVKPEQEDPFSTQWYSVDQIMEFKETSNLNIIGVGYTLYIGSEFESDMIQQAAQAVYQAHQHGLLSIVWAYPRRKAVTDSTDPHIVASSAGIAAALGADFVKVDCPQVDGKLRPDLLQEAVLAAGNTRLICSGSRQKDPEKFLTELYAQLDLGKVSGNATGRNIHQRALPEAVRLVNAMHALTIDRKPLEEALSIYNNTN